MASQVFQAATKHRVSGIDQVTKQHHKSGNECIHDLMVGLLVCDADQSPHEICL